MRTALSTPSAATLLVAAAMHAPAAAETPVERGRDLMQSIVACGNCHTRQGPNGPAGPELAGSSRLEGPTFAAYASNITPDADTGIGRWTDAQLITAIREGRRPDGTPSALARYSDAALKTVSPPPACAQTAAG